LSCWIVLKEVVELEAWLYQSRRLHREAVELIPDTTEAQGSGGAPNGKR